MSMNEMLMGMAVETTGNEKAPYILHGPRGACYGLLRYPDKPEFMYAVNLRGFCQIVSVKGNYTFTDRDGELSARS